MDLLLTEIIARASSIAVTVLELSQWMLELHCLTGLDVRARSSSLLDPIAPWIRLGLCVMTLMSCFCVPFLSFVWITDTPDEPVPKPPTHIHRPP